MIENTRFHEGYYSHIRKTQSDTGLDMVCHTGTITMIAKYEKYPGRNSYWRSLPGYWVPVARVGNCNRILKIELPCPIVAYEISDFPEISIPIKKL